MIPNVDAILSPALAAIAGDRIYRTVAPQGVTKPYAVWAIVTNTPRNSLACAPGIDNARVQVDCYATSQTAARQLCEAAQAAVEAVTHVIMGPVEFYEPETKLYRWTFDASFWTPRA